MIMPNGKHRFMKAQQHPSYRKVDQNTFGNDNVDQYDIVTENNDSNSAVDWDSLKNNIENPQENKNTKIDSNKLSNLSDDDFSVALKGQDMRSYVFAILQTLGVPMRKVWGNSDKIFKYTKDGDNNVSGFFMIPSFVDNSVIDQNDAESIADAFKEKFDIRYTLSYSGNNYKIDFQSKDQQNTDQIGSSFDEMFKGSSNDVTMDEMIKTAKERLVYNLNKKKDLPHE